MSSDMGVWGDMSSEVSNRRSWASPYAAWLAKLIRLVGQCGITDVERRYRLPVWVVVVLPAAIVNLSLFLVRAATSIDSELAATAFASMTVVHFLLGVLYAGRYRLIDSRDMSPEVSTWCSFRPDLTPYGRWRPRAIRVSEERWARRLRRLLTLCELSVQGLCSGRAIVALGLAFIFQLPFLGLIPGLLLSVRLRSAQIDKILQAYGDYVSGQAKVAELQARAQLSQRQLEQVERQRQAAARALGEVRETIAKRRVEIAEIERGLTAMKDEQARLEGLVRSQDSAVRLAAEMNAHNTQVRQILQATREISTETEGSSRSGKLLWWIGIPVSLVLNLLTSWIWDTYARK
ncbi:MAG: hypothetical protein IPK24_22215 [Kineosporiaceae bacterium]|nr:hypothetical protein [Kineosporiaceae bacterium]